MSDTIGIEEELKKRISDIVGKDISVRQLGKIVELFKVDEQDNDEHIWDEMMVVRQMLGMRKVREKFSIKRK